jgi:arylsulfatase
MDSRNIILITVDSVRADYCGFLSEERETTPTMDRLANDSIVFENAVAPGPQTLSSVPAIHTGTPFPVTDHSISNYQERIGRVRNHVQSNRTIAERFKRLGYSTACIEANPWTSRTSDFDKGYDVFHDVGGKKREHVSERFQETALGPPIRVFRRWYHNDGWFSRWPQFYDEIIATIDDLSEPYFLWIFLLDTHNPYLVGKQDRVESSAPGMYYATLRANSVLGGGKGTKYSEEPASYVIEHVKRAYRDSIRSVDRFVNELLADLSGDDPVLSLYSDHGEGFGEHGLYGHQHALFEENIHVPWIMYNTGVRKHVSEPVSLLTLPDLLEEFARSGTVCPSEWTEEYVFSRTEDGSSIAVRGERWKYILSKDEQMLFDLRNDPGERSDVHSENESVTRELRSLVESHRESLSREDVDSAVEESEEFHDRLDALGYVG